jgi:glycyl-tRNA synthetase beta chain
MKKWCLMKNLLLELFVEELPPKALKGLGEAFAGALAQSLRTQGLCTDASVVTPFASPRRLAVHVTQVRMNAPDKPIAQKLMPVSVGITADGQASPALLKKLAALGVEEAAMADALAQLRQETDGKIDILWFDRVARGATLAHGLQKALEAALAALPIPKVMSYQLADGWRTVNFVRPAHGLVALHGADIVPVSVLGLDAGRITRGHRFEAKTEPIELREADTYAQQLLDEGAVIASFETRRAEIAQQLQAAAIRASGRAIQDDALLDEVTALVERPNVLMGHFEKEFLAVPQECLILTMKANQKYFPLLDAQGKLTHQFLIVSNIRPDNPAAVVGGNERVVRPRLADAQFFFDQDRKKTLAERVPGLAKVIYHNQLGTQGERSARVVAIAAVIARRIGDAHFVQDCILAARLSKADLLTDMVGEFPELQGTMGRYYALAEGLAQGVADAIEDHYKPRFAGDTLPRNPVGAVVALADKLETLTGLLGIGQRPTGDKDPFALRRHALGVIRILREGAVDLPLDDLLAQAAEVFAEIEGFDAPTAELSDFIFERLVNNCREQGYSAQELDAVVSLRPQRLIDIDQRLSAVRAFIALPEGMSLSAANKRVGNILKKSERDLSRDMNIDTALLLEPAEQALSAALLSVTPQANAAFDRGDYHTALSALAALKAPVDRFFNDVMVHVDDERLRINRLNLLSALHSAMNRVADLSRLSA